MAQTVTFNNATYSIPDTGDLNWGNNVTDYLVAIAAGALQPTGGSFFLTADVDFGPNFGLKAKYYKSRTANLASAGVVRLAQTDTVVWRNVANSADLPLAVNGSNLLTFNGIPVGPAAALMDGHIYVGNMSNQPADVAMSGDVTIIDTGATTIANSAITDAKVNASAAIALSKLASVTAYQWVTGNVSGVLGGTSVTGNKAVASDSNGLPVASTTTDTELGYVHGVTSAIQTQINAVSAVTVPTGVITMYGAASAPTGWLLCDGSAVNRTTFSALFAVISTTFGVGNGSTTFNVPDFTNRAGVGPGSVAALGATAGSTTHTLSAAEIPSGLTVTDPGHHHALASMGIAVTGVKNCVPLVDTNAHGVGATQGVISDPYSNTIGDGQNGHQLVADATTGISVGGGGGSHSIVQPVLGVTYIIKT